MAGIKISELPEASCIIGDELVAIVQGSCTKFTAASAIGSTGSSDITSVLAGCGLDGGGSAGDIIISMDANCLTKYDGTTTTLQGTSGTWDNVYTHMQDASGNWDQSALVSCPGLDCTGTVESFGNGDGTNVINVGSSYSIDVDNTVVRTTAATQCIAGVKCFTGNILSAGVNLDQLFGGGGSGDIEGICLTGGLSGASLTSGTACIGLDGATAANFDQSGCAGLNCVGDVTGVTAGDGLTGGGTGGSIGICVDSTVVRTCGNQTIGGTKHFTASQTNFNSVSGTGYIMTGSDTHCIGISDTDVAIIGGNSNTIAGTACCSAIIAGANNTVCNTLGVAVGGQMNCVVANHSSTIGGALNKVCGSGAQGVVLGGCTNIVKHNSSVIAGGTDMTSVSGCMLHTESLYIDNLPTSDPGVAGVVWNDSGTLKISI